MAPRGRSSAREFAILVFLIVISVAIGIARPSFFSTSNLLAMGRQMAEIAIMGAASSSSPPSYRRCWP